MFVMGLFTLMGAADATIHCRGSVLCRTAGGDVVNKGDTRLEAIERYLLSIHELQLYQDSEHIACLQTRLGGGICAFFENTQKDNGRYLLTAKLAQALTNELKNKGCKACGNTSVDRITTENSQFQGRFVVNYVSKAKCNGICPPKLGLAIGQYGPYPNGSYQNGYNVIGNPSMRIDNGGAYSGGYQNGYQQNGYQQNGYQQSGYFPSQAVNTNYDNTYIYNAVQASNQGYNPYGNGQYNGQYNGQSNGQYSPGGQPVYGSPVVAY
ncbi:hypothetical protein CXG81DRAFT_25356 [Caulochytrium protostelioides]|nr:hypothetical protein CXG81DRAFT_25356 [Caulochytrium protostelioides]|eukprot:RKP02004.1 hypothetical protein CXG81DRAFT_25356 [Caulochytrium protostelioides]